MREYRPVYQTKVLLDKGIIDKGIIRTKVLQDKGIPWTRPIKWLNEEKSQYSLIY